IISPLAHPRIVRGAVFSPDDRVLATACCDGKIRLWEVGSGQLVRMMPIYNGEVDVVRFSRDGRRLLVAGKYDKTARLLDAETGRLMFAPMRHAGIVWDAVFDPDEHRVLTVSQDLSAAQWDAGTGERMDPPLLHQRGLNDGGYDGTGRLIATSSTDQTVR